MISEIKSGTVHGSCVDFDGKSILAMGPSGAGKTSLALKLIALGGVLVSDDQVVISVDMDGVHTSPPSSIAGKIEARNVGILQCPYVKSSRLNLIIDLSVTPQKRMPDQQSVKIGVHHVDVIAGDGVVNLPMAARLLNLFGRDQVDGIERG